MAGHYPREDTGRRGNWQPHNDWQDPNREHDRKQQGNSGHGVPTVVPQKAKPLNEYFVDGEGISRHVLHTERWKWLTGEREGEKGQLYPGKNRNGRFGYSYFAHSPLTPEMIKDLKKLSKNFDHENRMLRDDSLTEVTYEESQTRKRQAPLEDHYGNYATASSSSHISGQSASMNNPYSQEQVLSRAPTRPSNYQPEPVYYEQPGSGYQSRTGHPPPLPYQTQVGYAPRPGYEMPEHDARTGGGYSGGQPYSSQEAQNMVVPVTSGVPPQNYTYGRRDPREPIDPRVPRDSRELIDSRASRDTRGPRENQRDPGEHLRYQQDLGYPRDYPGEPSYTRDYSGVPRDQEEYPQDLRGARGPRDLSYNHNPQTGVYIEPRQRGAEPPVEYYRRNPGEVLYDTPMGGMAPSSGQAFVTPPPRVQQPSPYEDDVIYSSTAPRRH